MVIHIFSVINGVWLFVSIVCLSLSRISQLLNIRIIKLIIGQNLMILKGIVMYCTFYKSAGCLLWFSHFHFLLSSMAFSFYFIFSKRNAMPCISSHINKDKWTQCPAGCPCHHISQIRKAEFNHQQANFSFNFVPAFTSNLHHAVSCAFFMEVFDTAMILLLCVHLRFWLCAFDLIK